MALNRTKVEKMLQDFQHLQKGNRLHKEEDKFKLAICYVQLNEFAMAQQLFHESCLGMLSAKDKGWLSSGEPDLLVDVWILSGHPEYNVNIQEELTRYYRIPVPGGDKREDLPFSIYTRVVMQLLYPTEFIPAQLIEKHLKTRKWKYNFALGETLESILTNDTNGLHRALLDLLAAHERMAKFGSLREHPLGLLCLPAMSIVYTARKRDMHVKIEHNYLSIDYLNFLEGEINS